MIIFESQERFSSRTGKPTAETSGQSMTSRWAILHMPSERAAILKDK
jgi:hypothetical protein